MTKGDVREAAMASPAAAARTDMMRGTKQNPQLDAEPIRSVAAGTVPLRSVHGSSEGVLPLVRAPGGTHAWPGSCSDRSGTSRLLSALLGSSRLSVSSISGGTQRSVCKLSGHCAPAPGLALPVQCLQCGPLWLARAGPSTGL